MSARASIIKEKTFLFHFIFFVVHSFSHFLHFSFDLRVAAQVVSIHLSSSVLIHLRERKSHEITFPINKTENFYCACHYLTLHIIYFNAMFNYEISFMPHTQKISLSFQVQSNQFSVRSHVKWSICTIIIVKIKRNGHAKTRQI